MHKISAILLIPLLAALSGCKPTRTSHSAHVQSDQPVPIVELETVQPETVQPDPVQPKEEASLLEFTLLPGVWEKYLSEPPRMLLMAVPSKGMADLLSEEQRLIQSVLEADANVTETTEHNQLEDRLDGLKLQVPSAETSSGYVRRSRRRYRSSYISGNTIYTNSSSGYYSYSVFAEKEKSSSPILVKSVAGIASNAELDDLDLRIDALQQIIRTWAQRTALMSPNGTSGIMREANEAYLDGLKGYTKDFIQLRTEVENLEKAQALKANNKNQILEDWKTFEDTRLPILNKYLSNSSTETIEPSANLTYSITKKQLNKKLLLACKIGPRVLYFEIVSGPHPNHPFILADTTTR